jgi:hypothetical protein
MFEIVRCEMRSGESRCICGEMMRKVVVIIKCKTECKYEVNTRYIFEYVKTVYLIFI